MVPSAAEGGEAGGDAVSLSEVAFCLGEGDESAASPFSLCSLREKVTGCAQQPQVGRVVFGLEAGGLGRSVAPLAPSAVEGLERWSVHA